MSDDNIHVLGTKQSEDSPMAAALKIVEFAKREDCMNVIAFGTIKRGEGIGIVPMASAGTLTEMNMVVGCATALCNFMWNQSMRAAEPVENNDG
jgi:hypothetical protein